MRFVVALLSLAAVLAALILVLARVKGARRGLRVGTGGHCGGDGSLAGTGVELLDRAPIGPKQGIALVRVHDRVLACSVGEGGVRTLDVLATGMAAETLAASYRRPASDFARIVQDKLRQSLPGSLQRRIGLVLVLLAAALVFAHPSALAAQNAGPSFDLRMGGGAGDPPMHVSGPVGIVIGMGLLSLLPMLLLLMTPFTRILIVLHMLRQALGTQTAPPTLLLTGMALILTSVIAQPVLNEANRTALQPYLKGEITQEQAFDRGLSPFRTFMIEHTRTSDLSGVIDMSRPAVRPRTPADVPTPVLALAFVLSELKSAFIISFVLYLPFVLLDIVVASVLSAMGMMLVPPVMISLPAKLLLFVLVDGWYLVVNGLVQSYK